DARLELQVDLPELLVLALEAGDLDRVDPGAEVGPDEEGCGEGEEEERAGDEPDLEVRDPPLAQLGMGVRDEDDRVVLSWHGQLYKSRLPSTNPKPRELRNRTNCR